MKSPVIRILQGFLTLLLIASIVSIIAGFRHERKLRILKNEGKAVEGKIIESGKRYKNLGFMTYYIKVLYVNDKGEEIGRTYQVDKDDYDYAVKTGSIPVTIVAEHPKLSAVGQSFGYNRKPLLTAVALSIISFTLICMKCS